MVAGDEVDASNDARSRARAAGVEDLDGVELGLLGNTIGSTTDGASDVGTVAVAVCVRVVNVVGGESSTATEILGKLARAFLLSRVRQGRGHEVTYRVRGVDTSVNHVRASTRTSAVVIDIGGLSRGLLRNPGDTPRGVGLGDVCIDGVDGLLLDVLDLCKCQEKGRIQELEHLPQGESERHQGPCRRACRRNP